MRIWILSDLHLELSNGWDLPHIKDRPAFDVLVVAGDLIPRMERGVRWLMDRVDDRPVIYIAGNHEGYGTDIDRTIEKAKACAVGTNILVLENESTVINDVTFICASMWTDFNLFGDRDAAMRIAAEAMNDYRRIRCSNYQRKLRPYDTWIRHDITRAYIDRELSQLATSWSVVVTHHAPYLGALSKEQRSDIISAAYASDLRSLIESRQPDIWIYGHTHRSDNSLIGCTRVISNSKGYGPLGLQKTWENPHFDVALTIELNSSGTGQSMDTPSAAGT